MKKHLGRREVFKVAGALAVTAACGGAARLGDSSASSTAPTSGELRVETFASGLTVPWALAFAPDGRIFVTERPGRLRLIQDGRLRADPIATIPDVEATGEGGLLGMALDPDFAANGRLYLYHTYRDGSGIRNRVVRNVERNGALASREILIDGIPGAGNHNGGRIAFGPDGRLYIATGDAGQRELAQDRGSLAGKILRLEPDGSIPSDNPFSGSPVYSYGHRNPQGLAWQPGTARLYSTEHGQTANDEVNLIEAGKNYGWPTAEGAEDPPGMEAPVLVYTNTVAPAGAAFFTGDLIPQWQGSLVFGALRGTHLHLVRFGGVDSRQVTSEERRFQDTYGRLREVAQGPDGALYVTTSNRDGRGTPATDDDRILRLSAT